MSGHTKDEPRQTYLGLNPAQLKHNIIHRQDRLVALATSTPKEVKTPPNRSFNQPLVLEATFEDIFGEATREGFEDILT